MNENIKSLDETKTKKYDRATSAALNNAMLLIETYEKMDDI